MTKEHPDSLPRSPDNVCGSRDRTLPQQEGTDTPWHVMPGLLQPHGTVLRGQRDVTVRTHQLRSQPC